MKQVQAHRPEVEETKPTGRKIGYARVSTRDQNLDLQLDALAREGVAPEDIYIEKKSGKAGTRRPALTTVFKDIREGDCLVVWKLDRLGRSMKELIRTVELLRDRGAELKVTTMNLDTTTPAGKMMFHMFAAFAEFERDLIAERTKAGLMAARARGRFGGRRPVLTPSKERRARVLLARGMQPVRVARAIGVGKSTIYNNLSDLRPERAHLPVDLPRGRRALSGRFSK